MLTEQQITDRKIQTRRANIVFMAIGLFIMAATLLVVVSPFLPKREFVVSVPTVAPAPKAFDACVMAQIFVKRELKSPATADFAACNDPDTYVAQLAGNIWKVTSYVDAENGFGALLRADYSTEMRYNPATDKWTLTNSSLVNR